MSLARRLMASAAGTLPSADAGQVEYVTPGTYQIIVPAGVEKFSGVAISAGLPGLNLSPFNGQAGGDLHWRNDVPCTPGETLTIVVGSGGPSQARTTAVKRGSEFLLRAESNGTLYYQTLGGGGGRGGAGGAGSDGNGGLGGGGPGYAGRGGRGGNYLDTAHGQLPDVDSGGGRGGDINGVPNGWTSVLGEGTGLLGRSADKTTSLGPKLFGFGDWGGASGAGGGGVRLMWSDSTRSYPDNAPDRPVLPAVLVSATNGSATSPTVLSFHTDAEPGDLLLFLVEADAGGTVGNTIGISDLKAIGRARWKQLTAADIAASLAGTVTVLGSGTRSWTMGVYRGPLVATPRSAAPTTPADTVVIPGVTKHPTCQRLVLVVSDLDAAAVNATPAGFTSRSNRTTPQPMRLSDIAPADYIDGTDITLTGMVATNTTYADLIELR